MVEKTEVKGNPALLPKHKYLICSMSDGIWGVVAARTGLWEAHQKKELMEIDNRRETYKVLYVEDVKLV